MITDTISVLSGKPAYFATIDEANVASEHQGESEFFTAEVVSSQIQLVGLTSICKTTYRLRYYIKQELDDTEADIFAKMNTALRLMSQTVNGLYRAGVIVSRSVVVNIDKKQLDSVFIVVQTDVLSEEEVTDDVC